LGLRYHCGYHAIQGLDLDQGQVYRIRLHTLFSRIPQPSIPLLFSELDCLKFTIIHDEDRAQHAPDTFTNYKSLHLNPTELQHKMKDINASWYLRCYLLSVIRSSTSRKRASCERPPSRHRGQYQTQSSRVPKTSCYRKWQTIGLEHKFFTMKVKSGRVCSRARFLHQCFRATGKHARVTGRGRGSVDRQRRALVLPKHGRIIRSLQEEDHV
jgi:hypothetical protein